MPGLTGPIIKVRRGSGVPPIWTGSEGLTLGEFAYDKTNSVLYFQGQGGYTAWAESGASGGKIGATDFNVVPVGMQISSDKNFGSGVPKNERIGYSDYTIPTTAAVREYVLAVKNEASLGVTFVAGQGLAKSNPSADVVRFDNTGVLAGFTLFSFSGNVLEPSGVTGLFAETKDDHLGIRTGSGLQSVLTKLGKYWLIQNTGVTGINGATGNITNYSTIRTLSGYTSDTTTLIANAIAVNPPITETPSTVDGFTTTTIGHATVLTDSGGAAGTYGGASVIGGNIAIPVVTVNAHGHVTAISNYGLDFVTSLPVGFTEAVQDAAYPSVVSVTPPSSTLQNISISGGNVYAGLSAAHDDNNNLLKLLNTGVRTLSIGGNTAAAGNVSIVAGVDTQPVWSVTRPGSIEINNTQLGYQSIFLRNASNLVPGQVDGSIYIGGETGNITAQTQLVPTAHNQAIRLYAGRGIGLSGGNDGSNVASLLLWNKGTNYIIPLNSDNTLVDSNVAGLSGNVGLKEGSNISFSIDSATNSLIISSVGGGGGGSVAEIQADYTDTQDIGSYSGQSQTLYTGQGVTGIINFMGDFGILTRQETGDPGTRNGDLVVGLSSRVYLPPKQFESDTYAPHQLNEIDFNSKISEFVIPRSRDTRSGDSALAFRLPAPDYSGITPYNRVRTEYIEGGLTATLSYDGQDTPDAPYTEFSPAISYNGAALNRSLSKPGNVLVLLARPGELKDSSGNLYGSTAGQQAEMRLLAWPNPENLAGYIDQVFVGTDGLGAGNCPGGECNDEYGNHNINNDATRFLPKCATTTVTQGCDGANTCGAGNVWTCVPGTGCVCVAIGNEVNGSYNTCAECNAACASNLVVQPPDIYTGYSTGTPTKASIVANGNLIARDSVFVGDDIWLTGNLIDAKTGCLYGLSGAGSGGACAFDGFLVGNLTVTGQFPQQGNIYVHGTTAHFNVDVFTVQSPTITIGGQSGGQQALVSDSSDRGIIFNSFVAVPPSSFRLQQNQAALARKQYIGFNGTVGDFNILTDVSFTDTDGYISVSGTPANLNIGDLNGVGITASTPGNGNWISIRRRNTPATNALTSNLQLRGHAVIDSSATATQTPAQILLAQDSILSVSENDKVYFNQQTHQTVEFREGVTFDVGSSVYSGDSSNAGMNLKIRWGGVIGGTPPNTSGDTGRRAVYIRNPGQNVATQLLDVGRGSANTNATQLTREDSSIPLSNADGSAPAGVVDLGVQTIFNKHFGWGTVIDCGVY